MNAKSTTLDPHEEVYITFVEILARWRNLHPSNARRILNEMGLKPVRLSGRTLLYRLDELIAAENACRSELPPAIRGTAKVKHEQKTQRKEVK